MEDVIQISKLNDFIFSPKSIYYHSIYENFSELLYHDIPQSAGKIAHECIDNACYSSSKQFLQGMSVYSEKYKLVGKIDIYDQKNKILIERKNLIKKIYDGYIFQLYAQMFALQEAGYEVTALKIHSLTDNKRYDIPMPTKKDEEKLANLIKNIRKFNIMDNSENISQEKLDNCIYKVFYV